MLIHKPENIQEVLVSATRALGMTMPYREARLQAELLLAHALGISRAGLLARLDERLNAELAAKYAAQVARRAQHEPLAYIMGHREFYGLDFVVDRRVLVPRHETEQITLLALERVHNVPHPIPTLVDVGTGSGAIALTLAHHLPSAQVVATDISYDALAVAQINAKRLNLSGQVHFVQGDLLQPVTEPFDILVANLPYIPSERFKDLPREIRAFEPRIALDGGIDGLEVMRRLLSQLDAHGLPGAVALFEISEDQGKAAAEVISSMLPRSNLAIHQDLEGLDRVVEIQLTSKG